MKIRRACDQDIPLLTQSYNEAVRHSKAMWATECVTHQQKRTWLHDLVARGYGVFIAQYQNEIVGCAYYTPWMDYPCYRYTAEDSVYIAPHYQRRGIGYTLLKTLIEDAKAQDIHVLLAGIDSHNISSLQLHKKAGFTQQGYLRQVGQKFGQWLDLVYMCRTLK